MTECAPSALAPSTQCRKVEELMRAMVSKEIHADTHWTPVKGMVLDCVRDDDDAVIVALVKQQPIRELAWGELWFFRAVLSKDSVWWPLLARYLVQFVKKSELKAAGLREYQYCLQTGDWSGRREMAVE